MYIDNFNLPYSCGPIITFGRIGWVGGGTSRGGGITILCGSGNIKDNNLNYWSPLFPFKKCFLGKLFKMYVVFCKSRNHLLKCEACHFCTENTSGSLSYDYKLFQRNLIYSLPHIDLGMRLELKPVCDVHYCGTM